MSRTNCFKPPTGSEYPNAFPAGFCQRFPDAVVYKHGPYKPEYHNQKTNGAWRKNTVNIKIKHCCINGHSSKSDYQVQQL